MHNNNTMASPFNFLKLNPSNTRFLFIISIINAIKNISSNSIALISIIDTTEQALSIILFGSFNIIFSLHLAFS